MVGVGRYVVQKNFHLLLGVPTGPGPPTGRQPAAGRRGAGAPQAGRGDRKAGLTGRAVLTGYRRDVPAFLKVARVLGDALDYEGLPVTHPEALFCGVPAVVSDRVPSLEIAAEASLVCDRTPESIAEKLTALLVDDSLHARLSQAARTIAPGLRHGSLRGAAGGRVRGDAGARTAGGRLLRRARPARERSVAGASQGMSGNAGVATAKIGRARRSRGKRMSWDLKSTAGAGRGSP